MNDIVNIGYSVYKTNELHKALAMTEYLELSDAEIEQRQANYINEVVALQGKLELVPDYTKHLDSVIDQADKEIERIKAIKDRCKKQKDKIKECVLAYMNEHNLDKYEVELYNMIRKKTTRTVVDNVDALPDNLVKVVVDKVPDKDAIKKAINSGVEVNGAHLETNYSLTIK